MTLHCHQLRFKAQLSSFQKVKLFNLNNEHTIKRTNVRKKKQMKKVKIKKQKTCDVSAGDEQKPLSLDSPGFKRIAGVINYTRFA